MDIGAVFCRHMIIENREPSFACIGFRRLLLGPFEIWIVGEPEC